MLKKVSSIFFINVVCVIPVLSLLFTILSTESFALPSEHQVNGQNTGWVYPLDDNSNGKPIQNITFGFMSYNNSSYPYHYAQDITTDYNEDDPVYALSDGKIIRIRKSGAYGGGTPCNSDYNTLVVEYNYIKDINTNTIGKVYVFYGHIKNIIGIPQNATQQELSTEIPIKKGQKIAELNDPSCAGWPVHLHLTVMPDNLPVDYYDGYNDSQVKNGRARPFNCTNNTNGLWSKDWVDANGTQNIPSNDKVFFDTYKPYIYNKLPLTGQKKCYDSAGIEINCIGTGQDSEKQAGVGWPNPRFTPGTGMEADCITDHLTGMMWPRNGNIAGYMEWYSAIDYANNSNLCGYSDWRLPNVNELESLVNADVSNTFSWLNAQGFYNVQSSNYWSSTTLAYYTNLAWIVNMRSGDVDYFYKDHNYGAGYYYVWPVRSGQAGAIQLPETGQKAIYRTGDDGDLEKGVAWPDPRFTVNGDCVTDNLTGLMWSRNANLAEFMNWNAALNNANNLTLCGYSDWRLPNRKELRSLIDYSNYNPPLPTGHPFTNVQANGYWSSTTFAYYTDYAWVIDMWYGFVYGVAKNNLNDYVWPVRGGEEGIFITNADSSQYYPSLQNAYGEAYNFETLQCENKTINEDIIFNRNISIMIEGGYSRDFTSIPGVTEINGNVIINDGFVTMTDIVIR